MFTLGTPVWDIVLRTIAVYLVIVVGLRLSGKREIGQMTVFDLVLLLLLANAVQNAMLGPDDSLLGGVIAAVVLLAINAAMARLRLRWPRLRRMVEGSPTLLVLRGKVIEEHLRREGLDQEILEAALREHGISDLEEVEMAVLEIDGSISVVPSGSATKRVKRPLKYLRHV
ncbi:MAG TPA: YetF domain-containing protein [Anaerolineae bacterium]|nr:YetF domain-containing protein [Anaerolineae bacterium]